MSVDLVAYTLVVPAIIADVYRYIFNNGTKFLSQVESTMDLLIVCLTYLCFDALGDDLDEDQLQKNLFSGRYRLQAFASSTWFSLVKRYVQMTRDKNNLSVINGLMQNFFSELGNPKFRNEIDNDAGSNQGSFQQGRPLWPEAPEFISYALYFHRDHPKDLWTSNNGKRCHISLQHTHTHIHTRKKNESIADLLLRS